MKKVTLSIIILGGLLNGFADECVSKIPLSIYCSSGGMPGK